MPDRNPRVTGKARRGWRWFWLALWTLLIYGVSLVFTLPLALVRDWVEPTLETALAVHFSRLEGTVWQGTVEGLRVAEMEMGQMSWRWRPSALLAGRFGLDLHWQQEGAQLRGLLEVDPATLHFRTVQGEFQAADVQRWLALPLLLQGRLQVDIDHLAWNWSAQVVQARGRLHWADAAAGWPQPFPLGGYVADLQADQGRLSLRLDTPAPEAALQVSGQVLWQPLDRYRLDLRLVPDPTAAPSVRAAVSVLAQPAADGSWRWILDTLTEPPP